MKRKWARCQLMGHPYTVKILYHNIKADIAPCEVKHENPHILAKNGHHYWSLDQWPKQLYLIDLQTSNYKESKHQFVLIVIPWMQRPRWPDIPLLTVLWAVWQYGQNTVHMVTDRLDDLYGTPDTHISITIYIYIHFKLQQMDGYKRNEGKKANTGQINSPD